jgi:hypothetical protein
MATINQVKQLAETDTPLLFFQCILSSGDIEYWCTHSIAFNGNAYAARVLRHNLFELQLSADDAMDGISQLSVTLANADSELSEINAEIGFKGAQLTVFFAFADLASSTITTESAVLFRGIAGDPDEIAEDSLRLTFTNRLSLQRIPIPEVRVQRSCPWSFPTTVAQRTEALTGGANGRYSRFYRCGYSADLQNGCGTRNSGAAFTSCDGSRTQCQQRGMFNNDTSGKTTRRFGGFEFVPSAVMVRTSGAASSHLSPLLDNSALYNDPVPLVYGTGWLKAPVVFARNDGNLTRMETLLGMGVVQSVLKVVVNDIEIPLGIQGRDMTATGWYSLVTTGTRTGSFNPDFTDSNGTPLGDPYGSMSVLSIAVPNRISSGKSLPAVEVLMQGMQIDSYNPDGTFLATGFTDNPAWVILDILRRCGWSNSDLSLSTFAAAAAFCQELINTTDINGNPLKTPRYECNLIVTKRQSAATAMRGIRVGSSLMLRYGPTGLLELLPETTLATQQPVLPDGGNSTDSLNGGWPVYEFSDASEPFSGIVRNANGTSSVRLTSRTIAETSNRLSVEFQDAFNEYQQDSLSIVNDDDAALIGYEVTSQSTALGIANMSQANRVLLRQLDKSVKGNLFVQFQTSFRALKVRPGDIVALTYLKEGFSRTPFRVLRISPSTNYRLVNILAQVHDDDWYSDNPRVLAGSGRQPGSNIELPRPLIGLLAHDSLSGSLEHFDFKIGENIQAQNDGSATDTITVGFSNPTRPNANSPALPLLSLSPQYSNAGGSLPGGSSFYYAISAVDNQGNEGALSFTVAAAISIGSNTNSVTIVGLSFPTTAVSFNVYRGTTPQMLYRIATNQPVANNYQDSGAVPQPVGPPDASFDHANFYYRFEYAGPFTATSCSSTAITCADMGASPLVYAGMAVRIIEGTGSGQERMISTNNQSMVTVSSAWTVLPDTTSSFVITQASWQFAAVSPASPVQFEVGYRAGTVVQISGRAANVYDVEGSAALCPLTRFALGGGQADTGTTVAPGFTLAAPGGGELTLSQVGFTDLTNIASVASGTLTVFVWNELLTPSIYVLAAPLDAASTTVSLTIAGTPYAGQLVQVGAELMTVLSTNAGTNVYGVARGSAGSSSSTHNAGDSVLHLQATTVIAPFGHNFFANRASVNFLHTFGLPDVRVCAAQFFVTNAFGDSQAFTQCYTTALDGGLRTLSGGQFCIQVSGSLAMQQNAAPPLLIEASHAVRDIRASVNQAPTGFGISISLFQNGILYCSLNIPTASNTSGVLDGVQLPPFLAGASITMSLTLTVVPGFTGSISPGRDLTVTIRL